MTPKTIARLRRGLLFVTGALAIALTMASVVLLFSTTRRTLGLLTKYGYAQYLHVDPTHLPSYLYKCMNHQACYAQFGHVWMAYYPIVFPIGAAVFAVAVFLVAMLLKVPKKRDIDPATGRWSTVKDLQARGYLEDPNDPNQRGYVGMHPSGKMLRVPENIRFSHTLVLGGPGARKSTGYHWQNILSDAKDGWSVIVLDLKYPDPKGGFVSAVPYFEALGYNVQLFTPYDESTHHLPIIKEARTEQIAREIAEMIVPPDPNAGNAEFYRNNERRLVTGLLMHAADNELSLNELHDILQRGAAGLQKFIKGDNIEGTGKSTLYKEAEAKVRTIASALFEKDPGEQAGLITGLEGKLQFFSDTRLGQATRTAREPWLNIDLSRVGTEKTLLYIGIPQKYVDSGSGKLLLQLIKRMIDSALSETAFQNGGELPVPVSFYLDEFPSLGRLPNVESNFATMRSRRVAYHLTIQNISQGKAIYGRDGFDSFFTSNFQTIMLFPSFIKFQDAEYISKILGSTMTTMLSEGKTQGSVNSSVNQGQREATRPLVTVDEMQTWPPNEAIVILNGVPHTRVIVPGIWEESSGGVRNPFKPIYEQLDHTLNAQQYKQELLQRQKVTWQREYIAPLKVTAQVHKRSQQHEEHQRRQRAETGSEARRRELAELELAALTEAPARAPRHAHEDVWDSPEAASAPRPLPPSTDDRPAVVASGNHRINPKKALNRLAGHIIQAQADVSVRGERKKRALQEIRVPAPLVRQHLYDDEIEYFVQQGIFKMAGNHVRIRESGVQLLDDQWFRFFTKQLPVVTNKQKFNRRECEQALRQLADKLIEDDPQINVRVNGGTGQLERLDVNVWAIAGALQEKYQVGWGAHGLLTIETGRAIIRSKGLKALTKQQLAHFQAIADNPRRDAEDHPSAPAQDDTPPADHNAQSAPSEVVREPEPADSLPQPATAPTTIPEPPDGAPEAAPIPEPTTIETPPLTGERDAPSGAPAVASAPDLPPAPEPDNAGVPAATATTEGGDGGFEWRTLAGVGMSRDQSMYVATTDEALERLLAWRDAHEDDIHGPGTVPPKHPLGVYRQSVLRIAKTYYAKHVLPALPGDPRKYPQFAPTRATLGGKKTTIVTLHEQEYREADFGLAITAWVETNAERIPGHPRFKGESDPLQAEYTPAVLRVTVEVAREILGHEPPAEHRLKGEIADWIKFLAE